MSHVPKAATAAMEEAVERRDRLRRWREGSGGVVVASSGSVEARISGGGGGADAAVAS